MQAEEGDFASQRTPLFYESQKGADLADFFMSLIHTCELCEANAFDYLTELQRNAAVPARQPGQWATWNYSDTLAQLDSVA